MEMLPAFTDVLHLPNLHRGEQVLHVVRESGAVSAQGLQSIEKHLRYILKFKFHVKFLVLE